MTTKALIRAEIERLKHYAEEAKMEWVNDGYNQNAFAEDCRISSFDKLLAFIDTLQDEPVSDDLEESAKKYAGEQEFWWIRENPYTSQEYAFKAGAEWQSKRDQETIETAEDHAFLAGSNWQKEQMMKNAVEGEVVKDISNKLAVTAKNINLDGFKFLDKVRIIILPKED